MSNGNPHAPIELGPNGSMRWALVHRSGMIYKHLTRVYEQLTQSFHGVPPADPTLPVPPHPFRTLVKDVAQPFELWPRSFVMNLAYHAPAEPVRHPMTNANHDTPTTLRSYLQRVRQTCRTPPPVQGDVWLRLLFHMLPVNSRFAYLQSTRPDAICCAYGCGAVETQSHAFYSCPHVHPIWTFHTASWSYFGVNFSWDSISDLDNFTVSPRSVPRKDALRILWSLLTATTVHLIWTQHNLIQYEHHTPLPPDAWHQLTFIGWMTSVRRWLRLQLPDCPLRTTVLQVLYSLRGRPNYRVLWAKYPHCLQLLPSPPST
ncbi:hypothetical protein AaE_013111 [Aphanomyces astaci]|uniref:Reverse transcriptase zinc-binding domain-containing protein n=1 Tax=Aphanomyces astaci TaxID=112090 RepID=A0A6A4Z6S3_APHAT|nr:hypothetical protein AaE_013111 [Aphanomyces astaci]